MLKKFFDTINGDQEKPTKVDDKFASHSIADEKAGESSLDLLAADLLKIKPYIDVYMTNGDAIISFYDGNMHENFSLTRYCSGEVDEYRKLIVAAMCMPAKEPYQFPYIFCPEVIGSKAVNACMSVINKEQEPSMGGEYSFPDRKKIEDPTKMIRVSMKNYSKDDAFAIACSPMYFNPRFQTAAKAFVKTNKKTPMGTFLSFMVLDIDVTKPWLDTPVIELYAARAYSVANCLTSNKMTKRFANARQIALSHCAMHKENNSHLEQSVASAMAMTDMININTRNYLRIVRGLKGDVSKKMNSADVMEETKKKAFSKVSNERDEVKTLRAKAALELQRAAGNRAILGYAKNVYEYLTNQDLSGFYASKTLKRMALEENNEAKEGGKKKSKSELEEKLKKASKEMHVPTVLRSENGLHRMFYKKDKTQFEAMRNPVDLSTITVDSRGSVKSFAYGTGTIRLHEITKDPEYWCNKALAGEKFKDVICNF